MFTSGSKSNSSPSLIFVFSRETPLPKQQNLRHTIVLQRLCLQSWHVSKMSEICSAFLHTHLQHPMYTAFLSCGCNRQAKDSGWWEQKRRSNQQGRTCPQNSLVRKALKLIPGNQHAWVLLWHISTLTHTTWGTNTKSYKSVHSYRATTLLGSETHGGTHNRCAVMGGYRLL